MPITASTSTTFRIVVLIAAAGTSGSAMRMKPNVPSLSMMLASTTEPAGGASTRASGSHVWNGNIGTFTANAMKNATKIQNVAAGESASCATAAWYEKFGTPVYGLPSLKPMYRMATSISIDPTIVYRKNLMLA